MIADWVDLYSQAQNIRSTGAPLAIECKGVGPRGKCLTDKESAYCLNGELIKTSCAPNALCDLNPNSLKFECIDVETTCISPTVNGIIDSDGVCENNNVVRCIRGQLEVEECQGANVSCLPLEGNKRVGCFDREKFDRRIDPTEMYSDTEKIYECSTDDELTFGELAQGRFIATSSCTSTHIYPFSLWIGWMLFALSLFLRRVRINS